jgi:hypothetical protein
MEHLYGPTENEDLTFLLVAQEQPKKELGVLQLTHASSLRTLSETRNKVRSCRATTYPLVFIKKTLPS